MIKRKKHILFVTHDASRTGAPLILLNFLKWLSANHPEVKFDVLFRQGGVLENEFCSYASKCFHLKNWLVNFLDKHSLWGKNRSKFIKYIPFGLFMRKQLRNDYSCVYVNTIANSDIILDLAKAMNCPIICHVHELESVVDFYGTQMVKSALPHCDQFIVPSDMVKKYMEQDLCVDQDKIVKIPEFIRFENNAPGKMACRRQIGIDEKVFMVCGSGTIDWRKGTDLFLQILSNVKKKTDKKIIFVWVGGDLSSRYYKELAFDIKKLGLQSDIIFAGQIENPQTFYGASDLFALTSREDPFPLVALEAASLGLPIVCFDNAVGSTEFVNQETGCVVPYLDVQEFAESVTRFINSPMDVMKSGEKIKSASNRYIMEPICENIFSTIDRII